MVVDDSMVVGVFNGTPPPDLLEEKRRDRTGIGTGL